MTQQIISMFWFGSQISCCRILLSLEVPLHILGPTSAICNIPGLTGFESFVYSTLNEQYTVDIGGDVEMDFTENITTPRA